MNGDLCLFIVVVIFSGDISFLKESGDIYEICAQFFLDSYRLLKSFFSKNFFRLLCFNSVKNILSFSCCSLNAIEQTVTPKLSHPIT